MFRVVIATVLLGLLAAATPAGAQVRDIYSYPVVQPKSADQFGNPEMVAMRPYKWMWEGFKSLVYFPLEGFKRGNIQFPVVGTAVAGEGLRKGTVEAGRALYKGAIFAALPEDNDEYKEQHRANLVINNDFFLSNASDFLFTWYAYPALKLTEHKPVISDREYEDIDARAEEIRAERKAAQDARDAAKPEADETRVRQAQRMFVGERIPDRPKKDEGRGNLLKLAR